MCVWGGGRGRGEGGRNCAVKNSSLQFVPCIVKNVAGCRLKYFSVFVDQLVESALFREQKEHCFTRGK